LFGYIFIDVVLYKGTPADESKQDTGRVKNGYQQSKKQVPESTLLTGKWRLPEAWAPQRYTGCGI
jgi:hypothetical protein